MKYLSCLLIFLFGIISSQAQDTTFTYLFKNKEDGYRVYRIPAIVKTQGGKILAFCEGRRSLRDHGDIDLVMRRSDGNGQSWSQLQVIWNLKGHTCGNPVPIIDRESGDVIVLATLDNDRVFVLRSADQGLTWQDPLDITDMVKPANWKWYATGPGHGIQLTQDPYQNRLVVACNHTIKGVGYHYAHTIFSDDGGHTWQLGNSINASSTDESTVVELVDGSLLLNMRNSDRSWPSRKKSLSIDGGKNWSIATFDSVLLEPVCQGTLLRYSQQPDVLFFCNPQHTKRRKNLTLSVSFDGGVTWTRQLIVHGGKAAYNDMVVLPKSQVLCLYETGKILPYSGIVYKIIDVSGLIKK